MRCALHNDIRFPNLKELILEDSSVLSLILENVKKEVSIIIDLGGGKKNCME